MVMEAYWTLRSLQNRQILYFPLHQSINYNSFEIHLPLPFIRAQNSILPMRFGNGSVWSPIVAKDTFSSPNFIFYSFQACGYLCWCKKATWDVKIWIWWSLGGNASAWSSHSVLDMLCRHSQPHSMGKLSCSPSVHPHPRPHGLGFICI